MFAGLNSMQCMAGRSAWPGAGRRGKARVHGAVDTHRAGSTLGATVEGGRGPFGQKALKPFQKTFCLTREPWVSLQSSEKQCHLSNNDKKV